MDNRLYATQQQLCLICIVCCMMSEFQTCPLHCLAGPTCATSSSRLCSRLFVRAIAELLSRLENKCASEVQLMLQIGQEFPIVCIAMTNNNAAADLQNSTNTMTLAAVTESDSLSKQTAHEGRPLISS